MKTARCAKCQRRRPLKKLYLLASEHWCDNGRACTAVWRQTLERWHVQRNGNHDFYALVAEAKEEGRFIHFRPLPV